MVQLPKRSIIQVVLSPRATDMDILNAFFSAIWARNHVTRTFRSFYNFMPTPHLLNICELNLSLPLRIPGLA